MTQPTSAPRCETRKMSVPTVLQDEINAILTSNMTVAEARQAVALVKPGPRVVRDDDGRRLRAYRVTYIDLSNDEAYEHVTYASSKAVVLEHLSDGTRDLMVVTATVQDETTLEVGLVLW